MSEIVKGALLSSCGKYRYWLSRQWSNLIAMHEPPLVFVMLNPSIADHEVDDPTIRRCMGFAKREDARGMMVLNLFAARATDPKELTAMEDPIGPHNDSEIQRLLGDGYATVICAWGANKFAKKRASEFLENMAHRSLYCLGVTKDGSPRHPLYVPTDQPLEPYRIPADAHICPCCRKSVFSELEHWSPDGWTSPGFFKCDSSEETEHEAQEEQT